MLSSVLGTSTRAGLGSALALTLTSLSLSLSLSPALSPTLAMASAQPVQPPTPVVFDTDMDIDDASLLALLCEEDKLGRVDLRAVTITNNGFGTWGRTTRHARSVLDQCGLPDVPIAAGQVGPGDHAAPSETVATVESVLTQALGDAGRPEPPAQWTAEHLLTQAIQHAPQKVVVLVTGPMTNLAAALASRPGADWIDRIDRIQVMGGALDVPGNLFGSALPGFDNSQEFNIWLDPAAAQQVLLLAPQRSVTLVPLDATRFVPITQAFISRLADDQNAPGARLVYRMVSQPELVPGITAGTMYWWDVLAGIAIWHPGIITAEDERRIWIVQHGVQSGRTAAERSGTPVRVALCADQTAFEQTLLDVLNGRQPLAHVEN